MSIKDAVKKDFGNYEKIILKRFKSSKFIFVIMAFLFFSNYFLLSNFPNSSFLIFLLPIIYVGFLVGMGLLTFYSTKIYFKNKFSNIIYIIFGILLAIIGIIFSIPFLVDF